MLDGVKSLLRAAIYDLTLFRRGCSFQQVNDRLVLALPRDLERGSTAISDLLDWTLYTILPTAVEVLLVTGVLLWKYDLGFALIILATLVAYAAWSFSVTEWPVIPMCPGCGVI